MQNNPENDSNNEPVNEPSLESNQTDQPQPVQPEVNPAPVAEVTPVDSVDPVDPVDSSVTPATTEPTPASPFANPDLSTPTPEAKPPRKLKFSLLVGIIVAAAVVVLGGGSASAYFLWYQNPDKVVFDGITNATKATQGEVKGTIDAKSDESGTYKVTFDGKANKDLESEIDLSADITGSDNSNFSASGGIITDKDGNIYLKVNDVQKLLDQALGADTSSLISSYYGDIIKEVDGQWIKISSDDLKSVDQSYGDQQACVTTSLKSLSSDNSQQQELQKLFENNRFITVGKSLGSKSVNGTSSLGYQLGFDKTKAVAFVKGFGDTKFGKALKSCDDSYDFSNVSESDFDTSGSTATTDIWVSKFGHQITDLNITGKDDSTNVTIDLQPTLNKSISVTVPSGSKSIKDVYNDYQKATESLSSQYSSSDYTSSTDYTDPYSAI